MSDLLPSPTLYGLPCGPVQKWVKLMGRISRNPSTYSVNAHQWVTRGVHFDDYPGGISEAAFRDAGLAVGIIVGDIEPMEEWQYFPHGDQDIDLPLHDLGWTPPALGTVDRFVLQGNLLMLWQMYQLALLRVILDVREFNWRHGGRHVA